VIDLHCHILPGIDDGSRSLEMSLEMARMAVDDGITMTACTPHIYPGLYMNDTAGIEAERDKLQRSLDENGIPLKLTIGADVHLVPGLLDGLRAGIVPCLHNTHYPVFADLVRQGAWMQITAASLTGVFGARAKYWGERFLNDGLTHIIATDAHSNGRRSPIMSKARQIAERALGREEAELLVRGRQEYMLRNELPSAVPPLPEVERKRGGGGGGWWKSLFGARG